MSYCQLATSGVKPVNGVFRITVILTPRTRQRWRERRFNLLSAKQAADARLHLAKMAMQKYCHHSALLRPAASFTSRRHVVTSFAVANCQRVKPHKHFFSRVSEFAHWQTTAHDEKRTPFLIEEPILEIFRKTDNISVCWYPRCSRWRKPTLEELTWKRSSQTDDEWRCQFHSKSPAYFCINLKRICFNIILKILLNETNQQSVSMHLFPCRYFNNWTIHSITIVTWSWWNA